MSGGMQTSCTKSMKCFVSVGTTNFELLIDIVQKDERFIAALAGLGFTELCVQTGRGPSVVAAAADDNTLLSSQFARKTRTVGRMTVTEFGLAPSILSEIESADFCITHAGAGTCSEVLYADKPLIVVVNPTLMGNHQEELANALHQRNWALATSPYRLINCLEMELTGFLKSRQTAVPSAVFPVWSEIQECFSGSGAGRGRNTPLRTMVVMGSGGHTSEMLRLLNVEQGKEHSRRPGSNTDAAVNDKQKKGKCNQFFRDLCSPKLFVLAKTDPHSQNKLETAGHLMTGTSTEAVGSRKSMIFRIPRSREVKQSYVTSVFTSVYSLLACLKLAWVQDPDLLLCNGPGTCLPVCFAVYVCSLVRFYVALLLSTLGLSHSQENRTRRRATIVFVESVCRVTSLSATLRILNWFHLCNLVVLQWPDNKHLLRSNQKKLVYNIFFK